MKKAFIFFSIICFSCSCDSIDDTLVLKNSTAKDVYYLVLDDSLRAAYLPHLEQSYQGSIRIIPAERAVKELMPGPPAEAWRAYTKDSKDGYLHLYTFNLDTLTANSWKELVLGNKFDKELKYTYTKLEQMNWTINITE